MINLKTIAVTCIGLLCVAGCTSQPATSYTITGNIEGLPDGVHILLKPVSHDNEKPIADTIVTGGKFIFKGTANEPRAMHLTIKDAYGFKSLMLENADIKIQGKVTSKDYNGTLNYDFSALTVTGSPLTDKYTKLLSVRSRLDSIYAADNETFKSIRNAYGKARVAKDKAKIDSIIATEAYRASATADSTFFATVRADYQQLIMDNKDSFWGPLMMVSLLSYFEAEQKTWYESFSQEAKDSYYGKKVKEELYPAGKIGTKVPGFTVKSREGKQVTLNELCQEKKYILIDFWASWCNPCRKEIPNLKKLYAQYAAKGFQIISISIDKKEAEWVKALKEEQLQWPNFIDTEGVANLYKVKFVPTMYLIDGQGIMVGENLRGEALGNKLEELFGGE